jgi:uncharacterized membrane protein
MLRELPPQTLIEAREPLRRRRAPSARVLRARHTALELLLLVLMAALVPLRSSFAAEAVLLLLLLAVPGALLLRALRVPGDAILRFPVYVPCASVVMLMAAGLGVDLIGPQLGVSAPLRTLPMLVGVEALSLALLVAGSFAPLEAGVPWRVLRPRVLSAWPLLLPLAAAAGAMRLTAGHGAGVAVIALSFTALVLFLGVLFAGRMSRGQLSLVIYGAALAAAWSFTLRGHFLYGFDISSEYHVLGTTYASGAWHTSHRGDAYGAMVSLTVFPGLLHALTGISTLTLLKVVFPALFALFPAGLFALADRFLTRRYAFVAAAFIVVQSYFFQQLTGIGRQEIALLLFVGLFAAVLDDALRRRSQWPLVALLAAGVAISHYSTTYLTIALFAGGAVIQLIVSRFRDIRPVTGAVVIALIASVATAGAWYSPVTHSSSNLSQFVSNVRDHGLDLLPNSKAGQGPLQRYLSGNTPTRIHAGRYETKIRADYAQHRRYVRPLPAASAPRYAVRDAQVPGSKLSSPGGHRVLASAETVLSQLANVLAVLGALLLVFRRRTTPLLRQLAILGLGTLAFVVFVRVSGTAANAYNQERAFVQTMVPLGIALAWFLEWVGERRRLLAPVFAVAVALGLVVLFIGNSGLRGALTGGGEPANLSNKGEDYERFYVTEPELASASWLTQAPHGALVYADRYGQLRVLAATGRTQGLLLDVTPGTLDGHAWVYASQSNVQLHRARGELGSQYAIYQWPVAYLNDNYNVVYTNGSSMVYHR